jgi:hypothetical protein
MRTTDSRLCASFARSGPRTVAAASAAMRRAFTGPAENTPTGSLRVGTGSHCSGTTSAAVIVITGSRGCLAIPVVDHDVVFVDTLPVAAAFQRADRGRKQDQMYRTRSLHKTYCGFAEINWRSSAAVVS